MAGKTVDSIILYNGYGIPCIGFGTWECSDDVAISSVKAAIACGYRHIDTAAAYGNEAPIGRALAECGVNREELFVTSKVWHTKRGYEKTRASFEKSLNKLGLDYLDSYLIHWPASATQHDDWEELNTRTWAALVDLYKEGKVRSIGVSNFKPHHLEALMCMDIAPMINQIEFHPGHLQSETLTYCREHDILVEAWSPLGRGNMLGNESLLAIAQAHGKTVAHVCLRWCLQHQVVPVVKSSTPARIASNLEVFDFELTPEEMAIIDALPDFGWSGYDADGKNYE